MTGFSAKTCFVCVCIWGLLNIFKVCLFIWVGFTVKLWLPWNSFCRPSWPWTHKDLPVCLLNAGMKRVCATPTYLYVFRCLLCPLGKSAFSYPVTFFTLTCAWSNIKISIVDRLTNANMAYSFSISSLTNLVFIFKVHFLHSIQVGHLKYLWISVLCVWMFCPHICLWIVCMQCLQRPERKPLDLTNIYRYLCAAVWVLGNQSQVFCKNNQCS